MSPVTTIAATHHDEQPGVRLVERFTDSLGDRYEKYRSDGMRNAGTSSAPQDDRMYVRLTM
jgi:hypothetical protein